MADTLSVARHYLERARLTGERKHADVALIAALIVLCEELRQFRSALTQLDASIASLPGH